MEKEKVVEVVAKVQISGTNPVVGSGGFVRFAIQSAGGGVEVGRKLFVFDHRLATLHAAKAINPDASFEEKETLAEAIRQPAKVVVMKKTDGDKTFHYVNLYPTNGQGPTALFSETSYVGKHNAGFEVQEDNALWSWMSESSSRTGSHQEMVLVTLTEEIHRVIINSYGYANIGHGDENLTVIGSEIRHTSEEEFVISQENER